MNEAGGRFTMVAVVLCAKPRPIFWSKTETRSVLPPILLEVYLLKSPAALNAPLSPVCWLSRGIQVELSPPFVFILCCFLYLTLTAARQKYFPAHSPKTFTSPESP